MPAGEARAAPAKADIIEVAGSGVVPEKAGVAPTSPTGTDVTGARRRGIFSDTVLLLMQALLELVIVTLVAVIVLRHPLPLSFFRSLGVPVGGETAPAPLRRALGSLSMSRQRRQI